MTDTSGTVSPGNPAAWLSPSRWQEKQTTSRGMQNKRLIIFIRNHAVWNLKKPRNRTSDKTGDFSIAI